MALFPPGFRDLGASHLADRVRCASNSLSNPETLEWREFLDDGAIRCYNVLTPVLAPLVTVTPVCEDRGVGGWAATRRRANVRLSCHGYP